LGRRAASTREINYSGSAIAELEGGDSKTKAILATSANAWTALSSAG